MTIDHDEAVQRVKILIGNMAANFEKAAESFAVLREALLPDREAREWPIYGDEYGGIMCARSSADGNGGDCSCYMESSIILSPYQEGNDWPPFTVTQLLDAIAAHIEEDKERKLEKKREEADEPR